MKNSQKIAVVGAGFSGAVVARELAQRGFHVEIFESRAHLAGNCHTARDPETNVMTHVYGPHIFHTSNQRVWDYVQQFDEFMPYINRVKAITNNKVFSLPINLLTINNFFSACHNPSEASKFIDSIRDKSFPNPENFEQQALQFVGKDLYESFFKYYTLKQWGINPTELPASIIKRLPLRFNYDDNYYASKFQGIPKNGYTKIIENMVNLPNISIHLNTTFKPDQANEFNHTFYSGPIDLFFNHVHGQLGYRTLDFKVERYDGDYQGNAVINYCDNSVPWTRISEHKHFAPWEMHDKTIIYKEYSRLCELNDTPYYPIRLVNEQKQLRSYIDLANAQNKVTFLGRLGTYRYLDMHVTISEAFDVVDAFIHHVSENKSMPAFVVNPI